MINRIKGELPDRPRTAPTRPGDKVVQAAWRYGDVAIQAETDHGMLILPVERTETSAGEIVNYTLYCAGSPAEYVAMAVALLHLLSSVGLLDYAMYNYMRSLHHPHSTEIDDDDEGK